MSEHIRRDVMLAAEALRGVRIDLTELVAACVAGDAACVSQLFSAITDAVDAAHVASKRVALELCGDIFEDQATGRLVAIDPARLTMKALS
jgi:hypothetical protein